ncbi:PAS domain-containing protein [Massilia aurea]|uniref:PAS domain S-box protein n=1 Tax=Massilia aurea TaxID=373040 RepID=UPI0034630FC7
MNALSAPDLFFDQAACGLMAIHANGMIVSANASLHAWLGLAPGALAGRPVNELLPAGARLFHHTCCAPRLQLEGAIHDIQTELLTPGGTRLPVLLSIVRRREGDADIDHWALFRSAGRHAYENALLCATEAAEKSADGNRCGVRPSSDQGD